MALALSQLFGDSLEREGRARNAHDVMISVAVFGQLSLEGEEIVPKSPVSSRVAIYYR